MNDRLLMPKMHSDASWDVQLYTEAKHRLTLGSIQSRWALEVLAHILVRRPNLVSRSLRDVSPHCFTRHQDARDATLQKQPVSCRPPNMMGGRRSMETEQQTKRSGDGVRHQPSISSDTYQSATNVSFLSFGRVDQLHWWRELQLGVVVL